LTYIEELAVISRRNLFKNSCTAGTTLIWLEKAVLNSKTYRGLR
jgi:hypothetical protein